MSISGRRGVLLFSSILLASTLVISVLPSKNASALGQITIRSLTLQPGGTDGGSKPGGIVNHFFQFTIATTANIGSIQFLYCTTAAGTCIAPTGLVTTTATYGAES